MSRAIMTHRCTVRRDTNAEAGSVDAWGNPVAPSWSDRLTDQPCYIWQPRMGGEIEGRRNVNIYTWEMMLPSGTNVTEKDQITDVKDRAGDALTDETFNVVQIARKRDHLHLTLEVVSGPTEVQA